MTTQRFIQPQAPGLFDYDQRLTLLSGHGDPLGRLDAVVDWELFLPLVEPARATVDPRGPGGRPAWPARVLLKLLILQRLYHLSDAEAEYQLLDRLSFQRFVGLSLADKAPDQNTLRLFRETLTAAGIQQKLFDAFTAHLAEQGLLPKDGCIIDATFVEVPRQRNTRAENATIKAGEVPAAWAEDLKKLAHKDLDARWTKKNEETYYGYKDHVKVNARTTLIETAVVTAASVHDSQVVEQLIQPGDEVVFADSAYAGAPVSATLAQKAVAGCIVQPARRNTPLTQEEQATNREVSRVRARVEHPFALMSGQAGRIFQRYVGQARNAAAIVLLNLVYNLQRFEQIRRLHLEPQ
jgi:IS5 family transposase